MMRTELATIGELKLRELITSNRVPVFNPNIDRIHIMLADAGSSYQF